MLNKILKSISLARILDAFGLSHILATLLSMFSLSEIVGGLVDIAKARYASDGRDAVARWLTVPASVCSQWSDKAHGGDTSGRSYAIEKSRALGYAFADFVGAFVPAVQRKE